MKKQEMTTTLTEKSEELRKEMVQLNELFNQKKEQLTRIEGALEALSVLEPDDPLPAPEEGGTEE